MANIATVDQPRLAVRMGVHGEIVKPALNMSWNFLISHFSTIDSQVTPI
jgi:hypothetical protein